MNLELKLVRDHGTVGFTHGQLLQNGEYFCDTIEDQERKVKIKGATAIGLGRYRVVVDMSARFKRLMPLLLNVANFEGIRIHSGNTAKDTEGCILVGEYLADGYISNSRNTYKKLLALINKAIKSGGVVTIEVV